MAKKLSVDVDALTHAATKVTGQGDDVHTSHATASTRISAAEGGWAGRSAQALANRVAAWNTRTAELVTRIGDHGQGMHTSATEFTAHEERSSDELRHVASQLPNSL
ncbi:WXG100 family type VII secretion target [Mycobacterium sp. M26]|uniref:WXG100 family type VII secretion target n=1 Tax=Mycobacterium sp. M26 TaxID=1762962 RepID=UPI00073F99FF|nr:WXG100 family type VII secretion target [Mycobacterium sp. M26]